MLNLKIFTSKVVDYFKKKGWQETVTDDFCYLTKNYSPENILCRNKFCVVEDKWVYEKITDFFSEHNFQSFFPRSLINKNKDTDFIIAGLQLVNNYLSFNSYKKNSLFTLHPVIRSNIQEEDVLNRKLSSFVNLALIDVNTSIEEYLQHTDLFISLLSRLSLHSSELKIVIKPVKDSVRQFNKLLYKNGMKLQFVLSDVVVGVANLYQVECQENILVSDFGFGYENLLWCLNGKNNFFLPIYPKYEILFGDPFVNNQIRTIVLLVMSGVLPSSSGIGSKIRKLFNGIKNLKDNYDYTEIINYSYNYYSKFIQSTFSLEFVKNIVFQEIRRARLHKLYPNLKINNENIENLYLNRIMEGKK